MNNFLVYAFQNEHQYLQTPTGGPAGVEPIQESKDEDRISPQVLEN